MQAPRIPYTILALAPLAGQQERAWKEAPVVLDRQEPARALATLRPSLYISLPRDLCPAGGLQLTFQRLRDFTPDGLLESQPYLADLAAAGRFLDTARRQGMPATEIADGLRRWPDLPPLEPQPPLGQENRPAAPQDADNDTLDRILSMVASGPGDRVAATPGPAGPSFDRILDEILARIFRDPEFRQMEASWQGVRLLAGQGGLNENVHLQLVPATRDTLEETLAGLSSDLDRPLPSLLLVDCPFDSSARSLHLLDALARCGHALLVPALAWIIPPFFLIDSWQEMDRLPFLPHYLATQEFAKWRRLQESEAGRWLGLACNRLLCRFPWGADNRPRRVNLEEKEPPWVAPVWAAACLAGQAMAATGWPTALTDWHRHRITDLGLNMAGTPPLPVEILFSDSRMDQLRRCGIMALATARGRDFVCLGGEPMISADTTFSYQALLSRFTQFILWCRDQLSEEIGAEQLAAAISTAFRLFRQRAGDRTEDGFQVSVGSPGTDGRLPVRIQWTPPRSILPAGGDIILEFPW